MLYDRPVRELLADCVRELRAPFTREDVTQWFHRHYPLVKGSTVSTHLTGLTEGSQDAYPNLAQYPPLVRRVGHGLYEPTGHALGRGARPVVRPASPVPARPSPPADLAQPVDRRARSDVVLVGCVKSKRPRAAPARDLYTSPLFARRRRYAEEAGRPWYVLSARFGLVAPDEVIAPYDTHLAGLPAAYRAAWGAFVAEQLRLAVGPLRGRVLEVHAGNAYVEAVRAPLEAAGATVLDPVDARSMGETLAWYDGRPATAGADLEEERDATVDEAGDEAGVSEEPDDRIAQALAVLGDGDRALAVPDLLRSDDRGLDRPGLYSWWVDAEGAADLSRGLGLPFRPGLIYAGQAGATRRRSGRVSSNTLWWRLARMHARGRAEFSTFRRSLAAVLAEPLGLAHEDDPRLDAWIDAHLRVVPLPMHDADGLADLEDAVLDALDPPLNLQGRPRTPVRARLSELRRRRD